MTINDKILTLLQQLQSDISVLKQNQEKIQHNLNNLIDKVDKNHNELLEKLDELEAKNANRHIDINIEIKNINKDIKFIKHKLHQTEEDVFDIKDHLKLIK